MLYIETTQRKRYFPILLHQTRRITIINCRRTIYVYIYKDGVRPLRSLLFAVFFIHTNNLIILSFIQKFGKIHNIIHCQLHPIEPTTYRNLSDDDDADDDDEDDGLRVQCTSVALRYREG
jgi:hypothetical protein